MANRRTSVLIAAGAAVVVAGLVIGGVALSSSGVFGGGSEANVDDTRWDDVSPGNGPDTSVERDETGIERDPESGEPSLADVCWVYSGGGWLGGPCPSEPAAD